MADQAGSDTVHDTEGEPGKLASRLSDLTQSTHPSPSWKHEGFHGRPVSWVASVIIILGFLLGGVGLITGPTWWLFWTGIGVSAVGGILGLSTGIFNDWY